VCLRSRRADHEPLGDLAVRQADGHERHHFALPRRQHRQALRRRPLGRARLGGELLDQTARQARRELSATRGDDAHRPAQLRRVAVPQHQAAGARAERAEELVIGRALAQHQHVGPVDVAVRKDPPRHPEAIAAGQPDIDQGHVRAAVRRQRHSGLAVPGLRRHHDVGLAVEERAQARAHEALGLDQQDTDRPDAALRLRKLNGVRVERDHLSIERNVPGHRQLHPCLPFRVPLNGHQRSRPSDVLSSLPATIPTPGSHYS
jgi:hypothetical protein